MNKFLLLVVFSFAALFIKAQDTIHYFKPFKVDLSVGGATPEGGGEDNTKLGVLFSVEPKYAVSRNIYVGVRIEQNWLVLQTNYGTVEGEAKWAASYTITADYYFSHNYKFHPFGGAGLGLFTLAHRTVPGTGHTAKFGGFLRLGFEAKHFRFSADYNFVPSTLHQIDRFYAPKVSNSYVGIKVGIFLGGGRKKS